MLAMYPGKVNSPVTRLASAIDASQLIITVLDSSVFPTAPNLLVIGSGADAETCLYTNIAGNDITVQRGFQGVAKAWEIDMYVARNFTEYDYARLKANIENVYNNYELTDDPTGFVNPGSVVVTYNSVNRTITLTGTVVLLFQGEVVQGVTSGWVSAAHTVGPVVPLFLKYDGVAFSWSATPWSFTECMIAFLYFESSGTFRFGLRECHGLMPWQNHEANHHTVGTYRRSGSGGDLNPASYVIGSNVAANRRPNITQCTVYDEDIPTVLAALTSKSYTQLSLSGAAGTLVWDLAQAEIVLQTTSYPTYNLFTGGAWTSVQIPNNNSMSVWVIAFPVTADAGSQNYRFVFLRGQAISTTDALELQRSTSELALTALSNISPEFTFIAQIVIRRDGGGGGTWKINAVKSLTGTRAVSVGAVGNFLSSVSAPQVSYSGIASNLAATDVQAALDEVTLAVETAERTSSYVLALTDKSKTVVMNVTSASTVTIPTNAAVAFPIGTIITVLNLNTNPVRIVEDTGVTLRGFNLLRQYDHVYLTKRATNEWVPDATIITYSSFIKTGTQSIPITTPTAVTLVVSSDPFGFWNDGNPSRITIPTGVVEIKISAVIQMETLRRDRWHKIQLAKNGVAFQENVLNIGIVDAVGQFGINSPLLVVAPTDYFEVFIINLGGAAVNVSVANTLITVEVFS